MRFAGDALVPQTRASSTPHCDGCPPNETLIYDHCKSHAQARRPAHKLLARLPMTRVSSCSEAGFDDHLPRLPTRASRSARGRSAAGEDEGQAGG